MKTVITLTILVAILVTLVIVRDVGADINECTVYAEWSDMWCECVDRFGYFDEEIK